jgi:hypothetical protein
MCDHLTVVNRTAKPQSEESPELPLKKTVNDFKMLSYNDLQNEKEDDLVKFKLNLIKSFTNNLPHLLCNMKIGNVTKKCKALIDTGSGATFISQRLIKALNIPIKYIKSVGIQTFDGNVQRTSIAANLRNLFLYRTQKEQISRNTKLNLEIPNCVEEAQQSS